MAYFYEDVELKCWDSGIGIVNILGLSVEFVQDFWWMFFLGWWFKETRTHLDL